MSSKVFVLMFPEQELESFKSDWSEPRCSCRNCGSTTPYDKRNLAKILEQLQHIAGKNELPYPRELTYSFYENEQKEIIDKPIFFGKPTTIIKKYGDIKLYLHFNKEISEEHSLVWHHICVGVFAAMKAL